MGRSSVLLMAIALLAGSGGGCNGPSRMTPLSLFDRSRTTPSRERVAQSNPFKKAPARPRSEREKTADAPAAPHDAPAADTTSSESLLAAGHDPATRKFIEEELRDAAPEERAKLMQDLKDLQPALVRQILTMRRMVKQMGQDAPGGQQLAATAGGGHAGTAAASLQGGIQPVSGEMPADPADGPTSSQYDAGLGAVDPWETAQGQPAGTPFGPGGGHSFEAVGPNAGPSHGRPIQPGDWDVGRAAPFIQPGIRVNQSPRMAGHSVPPAELSTTVHGAARIGNAMPPVMPPAPVPAETAQAVVPAAPLSAVMPPPAPGVEPELSAAPGAAAIQTASTAPNPLPLPDRLPANGDIPQPPGSGPSPQRPAQWDADLQRVIGLTEAQVAQLRLSERPTDAEKRSYIEKHVYLRMLYLMAGRQERALTAIPGIDAPDQEFWQQTFWAVANYFDVEAIPDRGDRATQTVAQLRQAVRRLQETAKLDLRNVSFCHKIASFGDYERFERDEFSPGQPVLLYAEVGNFKSEPTVDGQFRTILRSYLEIYKAGPAGDLVERMDFGTTQDMCRNYRRDYFHSYEFTMPQKLSLGPHVLKLTVEDQLSQKVATYKINFLVK